MTEMHHDPKTTIFSWEKTKTKMLGFKAGMIVLLLLIFLIPLNFVRSIVFDRQSFKNEAVASILEPIGGEFSITGLSLLIEYFVPYSWSETLENGQKKTFNSLERNILVLSPVLYELDAQTTTVPLTRGIFSVPSYQGTLDLHARFEIPVKPYLEYDKNGTLKNKAFIAMGVKNNKTLPSFPHLTVDEKNLVRTENREDIGNLYANNIQFDAQSLITKGKPLTISGEMVFQGGNAVHFAPLAGDNVFSVRSDWKTPSFTGGWLPQERDVTDGFTARWQIAGISTQIEPIIDYHILGNQKNADSYYDKPAASNYITVHFFTPVESYRKTERSIKYALLFMLVPFLTIFLFEIFFKTRIHPIQYCLIGLANCVFYLLLLSISEHLSFNMSYLLSAFSVMTLTSLYVGSILKNMRSALVIALIQVVSYVFLFGTLQAEDYALLIGSLGLFAVVAVLMLITRKIDWYSSEPNT